MKEVWKTHGVIMYQILKLNKVAVLFFILFSACFLKSGMAENIKKKENSKKTETAKKAENVKFIFVEENKATRIFLFPGRISLLELPCPITKALLGSPKDIKAEVDNLKPKELNILLKSFHSKPSNLILKCDDKLFLFSLIPSKTKHYDFVKVLAHISSSPFKLKSDLPQSPSLYKFRGFEKKDFKIKKILDHSWELKK